MKIISVTKITKEQAINHKRRDYNPSAWKRNIELYSKEDCNFFENGEDVYAVYIADGIRFCQKLSYAMCLSAGGLSIGCFNDDNLFFVNAGTIANNTYNRKILRDRTKKETQIFFY